MDITAHAVKFIGRAALPIDELIPVQAARKAVDCQIAAHTVQRSREATVFRERQRHAAANCVTADVLRQDRGRQVQRAVVVSKSIVSNAPSSVSEPDVVSAESSPTAASVTVRSPLVLSKSRFS